jgi:hypothetical protein
LAERLKVSPEAARALAKRYRWPRSRANDGKTLVSVDLADTKLAADGAACHNPGHGSHASTAAVRRERSAWAELGE